MTSVRQVFRSLLEPRSWLAFGLAVAPALFVSTTASAQPDFPAIVQSAAGLGCTPTCRLCHLRDTGGFGTLDQFGENLKKAGAAPFNPQSVTAAIQCSREKNCPGLEGQAFDSDGDGTNDIDELDKGTNPAVAGAASLCGATYGCGARVEPKSEVDTRAAAAIALAAACMLLATRRARR